MIGMAWYDRDGCDAGYRFKEADDPVPEVYLDNAATTPVLFEASQRVLDALTRTYGNPSSPHAKGLEAERIVKDARRTLASTLGAHPGEIVFTSGGTEANALALKGAAWAYARRGKHVITTSIEHSSILNACRDLGEQGFRITHVRVNSDGLVDPHEVAQAVDDETTLVSVMAVNNEVGTVQPLKAIADAIRAVKPDVLFHVDGVQAYLKQAIIPAQTGIDLFTISGHKVHAPKGIGALYVRRGVRLAPLFGGGDHEGGLRSGTENVPAIAGFAAAVEELVQGQEGRRQHLARLKEIFLNELESLPDVWVNGPQEGGADHIINVSFPGVRGEVLVHELSGRQVYVATGSACSSRRPTSHVLEALRLPPKRLESAIRVSFSFLTTEDEVRCGAQAICSAVTTLRHQLARHR